MKNITVPALTHELSADADESFDPDGGPWTSSGIAVAPGDVLHMDDGTPVLMTEEELRKAAPTQADEPLSVDHPTDENGEYQYPPPSDNSPGKVTAAGYIDNGPRQSGVGYETSIHDPEIARGLHAENYEVSVHPKFDLAGQDPDTGAYVATNIDFRDLSIVTKGDSPSNTANWGASAELAAWANETDIGAELAASESAGEAGDRESLVSSAVNGTLRALGLTPGDVDADELGADDGESNGDEAGGTSGTDTSDTDPTNAMTNRDQLVETLVDDHGFEADTLESVDDDQLETMHNSLAGGTPDGEDPEEDAETETEAGDGNVVELDIGDHDSVDEYIAEQAEAAVASAQEATDREELIATISSQTDKDVDALSEWPTDALEDKASSLTAAASLPGSTGRHTNTVAASHSGDGDEDASAYGTGVEGN